MQRILSAVKISVVCLLLFLLQDTPCLAWTVSPVRFEVKAQRGKEYTLTFSVLNESQLYQKRFEIQTDDWIIDKNNNFLRKAFSKEANNKYSATSWIKVTPQQFVVPPGETKSIRFTVFIPSDLTSDGEYSTGIFVGEKNIEKPPKGEKIVHIKQDTFIGVIVYVRVGAEKPEVILKDLKINAKPVSKGLNQVTILPTFESHGNVHSRARIKVKLEPVSSLVVKETKSKIIETNNSAKDLKNIKVESAEPQPEAKSEIKEFNAGELVVLRESEVTFPIDIPEALSALSEWKFTVNADFGEDGPALIGTKKYKVPYIEMPTQKKKQ
ncbi:MAG: hypothetical protein HY094_06640 [Candidatus Melainabacteria bacterium]|nr:hypothetical protein [Candidatus Melainabacteria bacterium]